MLWPVSVPGCSGRCRSRDALARVCPGTLPPCPGPRARSRLPPPRPGAIPPVPINHIWSESHWLPRGGAGSAGYIMDRKRCSLTLFPPFARPGPAMAAALQPLRALSRAALEPRARRLHLSAARGDAVVISGRKLARQIRQEARHEVQQWVAAGNRRPHLSVVLVGENPASHSYVLNKTKAAADVGISSETILRPASISEEELLELIAKLNSDTAVDGLLVQLPLPEHIDERRVCNAVSPHKDVDGFHVLNVGRMCLDQHSMLPATPRGVWEIIQRTGIPTLGRNVVVAGRSKNVGMPIAMLLHTDGSHERPGGDATVTISHRYTPKEQLKQHTIRADIVVAAAGIPNLITADMIKEGAAVIDVGITRVRDPVTAQPRLVGDVDFEGVRKKASYITPVPGGVGPMTVAMLMKNTIIAAKKLLEPRGLEALPA
ncbi:bifunctional methylenetetrahydrofolate dehydrogenase/cyclohydrolase, mitochondrial [Motacilla alba alba]|uniref:bifunctional methylenetetrahydrofolate dehydrogenase/cyclohydrolase, mitochondrial n=1 Tax=Motacilla alba alba TaxID=1094192 RepID=UPI0018D531B5|nr:bifunctional methylenetetrahydrofolate dehydrogenase/cyclohydrolase, mitochondrial [Motacilla alba alba]